MDPIKNFPENVASWLHARGLTSEAVEAAQLSWNGEEIVIPVFDENGALLFNKYRRNPFESEGPKYRYEKGSTVALYNLHTIREVPLETPIFVCEGELDALLLNSKGLLAVTSTGGAGTFKKEWADYFTGKNVFIVFDRDEAGFKGAMKTQGILPFAKTIILPEKFQGNDVTDYFQTHSVQEFFAIEAVSYPIPREPSGMPTEKKEMKALAKSFGDACDALIKMKREWQMDRKATRHLDVFLHYVTTRYETFSQMLKNFDRRFPKGEGNSDDVRRAKEVSITNFVKFTYDGFACCLWHTEKTGSMKYNKPGTKYGNTVKCFGCGAMGDTIDVIMQLRNVEFGEAVKIILSHNG